MQFLIALLAGLSVLFIVLALNKPSKLQVFSWEQEKPKLSLENIPPVYIDLAGASGMFFLVSIFVSVKVALIAAPFGVLIARKIPEIYQRWQQYFRRKAIIEQMEGACMVISSSVRSGLTLLDAYQTASKYVTSPLKQEFQTIVDSVRYGGKTLAEALHDFSRRWKASEIEMLYHATKLATMMGGTQVPNIMRSVSNSVRERKQIDKKIKAKTTYQRISAFVISVVPIALLFVFRALAPDIFQTLMNEGRIFLFTGLVLTAIGWYIVFNVINIEEF